jgi:hypothetical protein
MRFPEPVRKIVAFDHNNDIATGGKGSGSLIAGRRSVPMAAHVLGPAASDPRIFNQIVGRDSLTIATPQAIDFIRIGAG